MIWVWKLSQDFGKREGMQNKREVTMQQYFFAVKNGMRIVGRWFEAEGSAHFQQWDTETRTWEVTTTDGLDNYEEATEAQATAFIESH
jgi:hypothetical protein